MSPIPESSTPKPPAEPGPQRKAFDLAMQELWEQTISLPGEPISVTVLTGKLLEGDADRLEPFLTD